MCGRTHPGNRGHPRRPGVVPKPTLPPSSMALLSGACQAVYSTQLWRIFSDDLLAEEAGANGESWEDQAQLFCACVERARHQGTDGESHSCQVRWILLQ